MTEVFCDVDKSNKILAAERLSEARIPACRTQPKEVFYADH